MAHSPLSALHCVGATTLDEYRQYIEKDAALERRFQKVLVDEPTVEDTVAILVKPGNAATPISCFGLQTSVTMLHAVLAKRTGLPVIPGICLPQPDGTYLLRGFQPLVIAPDATE